MNWNNKQNRDRLIDREQDGNCWGEGGDEEIEQKGKRTHGHGQQCGDCWGEEGIRELKGNGWNNKKKF